MIDPNSLRQRLLREAQETGVSVHTLYARHYRKKKPPRPRGAPVNPNSTRQKLIRLAAETGISYATLYRHLRSGVPFEQLSTSLNTARAVTLHNTLLHLSQESGVPVPTLYSRLRNGVPYDKITAPQRQGAPDAIALMHRRYFAMLEKYAETGDPHLPW